MGRGVNILWYNILTPPPHLVKFDETILEDCFYAVMINKPLLDILHHSFLKLVGGGQNIIGGVKILQ